MRYSQRISSPLGPIEIVCDEEHLLAINFTSKKTRAVPSPLTKRTASQLKEYFSGTRKKFTVPISFDKLGGTTFQKKVWRAMIRIPFGRTITYKDEAKMVGRPKAYRAVGSANGRNPIPVIIPCHRVVACGGKLGGYSSGVRRKKMLLAME